MRAAPRPLQGGEPLGERLVRLRDRPARRHVHAPLRLRHLGPRPGLLQLLVRGPARQGRRRADPASRGAVDRAAEDPRQDHARDLDPQGRGRLDPPRSCASRGGATGETGYWERDVADRAPKGLGVPRHRPPARPRSGCGTRAATRRATRLGRSENRRYGDLLQLQRLLLARAHPQGRADRCACTTWTGCASRRAAAGSTTCRARSTAPSRTDGKFTEVTVQATRDEVTIEELGWTFTR